MKKNLETVSCLGCEQPDLSWVEVDYPSGDDAVLLVEIDGSAHDCAVGHERWLEIMKA